MSLYPNSQRVIEANKKVGEKSRLWTTELGLEMFLIALTAGMKRKQHDTIKNTVLKPAETGITVQKIDEVQLENARLVENNSSGVETSNVIAVIRAH